MQSSTMLFGLFTISMVTLVRAILSSAPRAKSVRISSTRECLDQRRYPPPR
jgi:hypothetical protein